MSLVPLSTFPSPKPDFYFAFFGLNSPSPLDASPHNGRNPLEFLSHIVPLFFPLSPPLLGLGPFLRSAPMLFSPHIVLSISDSRIFSAFLCEYFLFFRPYFLWSSPFPQLVSLFSSSSFLVFLLPYYSFLGFFFFAPSINKDFPKPHPLPL